MKDLNFLQVYFKSITKYHVVSLLFYSLYIRVLAYNGLSSQYIIMLALNFDLPVVNFS
jgi:hypothetical protein